MPETERASALAQILSVFCLGALTLAAFAAEGPLLYQLNQTVGLHSELWMIVPYQRAGTVAGTMIFSLLLFFGLRSLIPEHVGLGPRIIDVSRISSWSQRWRRFALCLVSGVVALILGSHAYIGVGPKGLTLGSYILTDETHHGWPQLQHVTRSCKANKAGELIPSYELVFEPGGTQHNEPIVLDLMRARHASAATSADIRDTVRAIHRLVESQRVERRIEQGPGIENCRARLQAMKLNGIYSPTLVDDTFFNGQAVAQKAASRGAQAKN